MASKSSVRDSGKAKLGAAEKVSTGTPAARTDTKGRGIPDHLGKLSVVLLFTPTQYRNILQFCSALITVSYITIQALSIFYYVTTTN